MTLIYVPVEVSDDALAQFLAQHAGEQALLSYPPVTYPQTTQPVQAPQAYPGTAPVSEPAPVAQADPWTGQAPPTAPATQAGYPAAPPQGFTPAAGSAPVTQPACAHGPMRYVPAGVSGQGRAYGAFWGCPQPRNAVDKCKSVKA